MATNADAVADVSVAYKSNENLACAISKYELQYATPVIMVAASAKTSSIAKFVLILETSSNLSMNVSELSSLFSILFCTILSEKKLNY